MKSLIKEPLVHFALIGVLLFGLYAAVTPGDGIENDTVLVDEGTINSLQAHFERMWSRPATPGELQELVNDYVIEEVLYRQALLMGMDQNDPLIRRRLRQKMEFLTTDAMNLYQPTDAELEDYLQSHSDKYSRDPVYSFEQIYLGTESSQEVQTAKIAAVAQQLAQGKGNTISGDQSLLPTGMDNATTSQIAQTFGEDFVQQLPSLTVASWSDPIVSSMGIHFVNIRNHQPGYLPSLSQVRSAVLRDWQFDRNIEMKTALIDELRSQYRVEVEWPEGATQNSTTQNIEG